MRVARAAIGTAIATGFATLVLPSHPAAAGQFQPNFGNFFGAMLNQALTEQLTEQWNKQSSFEHDCLSRAGLSPYDLASKGIGPYDVRVKQLFDQCRAERRNAADAAANPTPQHSNYTVSGLAAGRTVNPDSEAYKAYKCRLSQEFPGYKWCARKKSFNGKNGPYDAWTTILHSDQNVAAFVLEDIAPAYFAPGDVDAEITRLSQRFGQAARVIKFGPTQGLQQSIIATWGALTLTPVDAATTESLARGKEVQVGLLVDFLADSRKSAREKLPVYHLGGQAGYIWAASYDDSGRGRLRIVSVDPSLLPNGQDLPGTQMAQGYAQDGQAQTANLATDASPAVNAIAGGSAPSTEPSPDAESLEKQRKERLEKALAAAKAQLEDVGAFLKENPQNPKLLDYVERAGKVSAAIKSTDPSVIERSMADLADALSHDKDYRTHHAALAEARKREEAQFLADAIRRGQQQHEFLLAYIAKNPIADGTPAFVENVKELESALRRATLSQLQPVVENVDVAIREANLQSDLVAFQKSAAEQSPAPVGSKPSAQSNDSNGSELPVTDKNRFLIAGDLNDLEILYNATAGAPHIALNLRGDYVFSENTAQACMFGHTSDSITYAAFQAIAAKTNAKAVEIHFEPCDANNLAAYDLIGAVRGSFLNSSREDALTLLKLVETGGMRRFTEITGADLAKSAQAEQEAAERVRASVADGGVDGFGIVLLTNHAPTLCVSVSTQADAHRALLLSQEPKIQLEMQSQPVLKDAGIEDAFLDAQKGLCGAIYASSRDLKALTSAFSKADIRFSLSSTWILRSDIDQEEAKLAEKARLVAQEATQRAQRNADEARLAAQRAADQSQKDSAKQSALREKFGNSAKAASSALGAEVISWTTNQNNGVGAFFPGFASWFSDKLADHWDITGVDNAVEDYGTANFKSRDIEAVLTRITLHLRNRTLGEYHDDCFVFGRINDSEFSMFREPLWTRCDDDASLIAWQSGHQFKSEWRVSGTE